MQGCNSDAPRKLRRACGHRLLKFVRRHFAMNKNETALDWLTWLTGLFAALVLLYFLTAPPIMMAAVKPNGAASTPAVYQPVMNIIESEFGGPLLWYCNRVWHMEIILFGEDARPPWYVVALYSVLGLILVAAVVFPFVRRMRRRMT